MTDLPARATAISRRDMLRLGATGGVLLGGPALLAPRESGRRGRRPTCCAGRPGWAPRRSADCT
jgi:hypothetical protein